MSFDEHENVKPREQNLNNNCTSLNSSDNRKRVLVRDLVPLPQSAEKLNEKSPQISESSISVKRLLANHIGTQIDEENSRMNQNSLQSDMMRSNTMDEFYAISVEDKDLAVIVGLLEEVGNQLDRNAINATTVVSKLNGIKNLTEILVKSRFTSN